MPDLPLLIDAARAAGEIALRYWRTDQRVRIKDDGGPVSDGDLAVDDALKTRLLGACPDHGWLSEETEDDPARLDASRVFIVDPIDGTRAYVDGQDTWAVSIAQVEAGVPVAGVVYLPKRDKLYAAARGQGATLNGAPIRTGDRAAPDGSQVLASRPVLDASHWSGGAPDLKRHFRPSLAYRICLVAEGRFDAMITVRPTWEWDIAAGAVIAAEAGARMSDGWGGKLTYNAPDPRADGVIVAPPPLHRALVARRAAG